MQIYKTLSKSKVIIHGVKDPTGSEMTRWAGLAPRLSLVLLFSVWTPKKSHLKFFKYFIHLHQKADTWRNTYTFDKPV